MCVLIHLCFREDEQSRVKNMIFTLLYVYAIAVW